MTYVSIQRPEIGLNKENGGLRSRLTLFPAKDITTGAPRTAK